jgi:hypothetical protein
MRTNLEPLRASDKLQCDTVNGTSDKLHYDTTVGFYRTIDTSVLGFTRYDIHLNIHEAVDAFITGIAYDYLQDFKF